MQEKTALGFFFSGHPYNTCKKELARFVRRPLNRLEPAKEMTTIAGVVVGVRTQMTRSGKMLFVQLDDGTGMVEVSVFNELFEAERAKIVTDEVLVIEGKVSYDDFSGGNRVVADKLMTLGEARARFAKHLLLHMNGGSDARKLKSLLTPFAPGPAQVRIRYRNADCRMRNGARRCRPRAPRRPAARSPDRLAASRRTSRSSISDDREHAPGSGRLSGFPWQGPPVRSGRGDRGRSAARRWR